MKTKTFYLIVAVKAATPESLIDALFNPASPGATIFTVAFLDTYRYIRCFLVLQILNLLQFESQSKPKFKFSNSNSPIATTQCLGRLSDCLWANGARVSQSRRRRTGNRPSCGRLAPTASAADLQCAQKVDRNGVLRLSAVARADGESATIFADTRSA